MRQGPLAGRYWPTAAMVVFALVPYLGLSAAIQPISPIIAHHLHMSLQAMSLTSGMANAAYALGAVAAVQFSQHFPPRRMLVIYAAMLVVGSVLAASATAPATFIAGHVIQGLCTALLLVAAAPPLIVGYPIGNYRWTGMILNLSLLGAVAIGPFVGGLQASAHAWRPLFWIVAGITGVALVLTVLTFQDDPPEDPGVPWSPAVAGLAASGAVATFYGASELLTHKFTDIQTIAPLLGGLALIVVLIVWQYRSRAPFMPLKTLSTTIPVAGLLVAITAAEASISAIALTAHILAPHYKPLHLGALYIPEFAGALIAAVTFGFVLLRRAITYFVLAAMIVLSAGIVVINGMIPPTQALTLIGSGLIGLGLGGSVAPALFMAVYSTSVANAQKVFAIVELLRGLAAFMWVPVIAHFAATVGGNPNHGTRLALWICLGISVTGALTAVALYVLGRVRIQQPDVANWLEDGQRPAWYSPPLLARIRMHAPPLDAPPGAVEELLEDSDDDETGRGEEAA
jgi:MFS family permease